LALEQKVVVHFVLVKIKRQCRLKRQAGQNKELHRLHNLVTEFRIRRIISRAVEEKIARLYEVVRNIRADGNRQPNIPIHAVSA
jgi:hypothetical protein